MSVWWPGVIQQITQLVQNCSVCAKESRQGKEPLMMSDLPKYPWQVVGTDLFELNKSNYLLVVDYFSRYPEAIQLTSTTSASVISALKSVFSRHGIPEIVKSDNGPQYSSSEFMSFASSYGFQHLTSSPKFPQSNGQVERSVQTVKNLLKSNDPYTSLLSYRATPLSWCDLSPAELSMGRRLRTSVPQTDNMLIPPWAYYLKSFRELDRQQREKQKENFDSRHCAKDLPPIPNDTKVWITTESEPVSGRVISPAGRPRSYIGEIPSGQIERNRSQLMVVPRENSENPETSETSQQPATETETPRRIMTRSRTGTAVNPPNRL